MSSDTELHAQVLAELKWDPRVNAAHIGVTARDGVVTLSGHVPSYFEKHAAEKAAGRVRNVKAVAEEITVTLPFGVQKGDEEIASAALDRLASNSVLPQGAIKVKVEKGWVTLTGDVDEYFHRESAGFDILGLNGVIGLANKIRIKATVNASDVSDDIRTALKRSWFFSPKTVIVTATGGNVCLSGDVHSLHDRNLANAIAWAAPGVTSVEDRMALS